MSNASRTRDRAAPPRLRRSGVTLAVIVACQLMIGIDTSIVTIALPEIQQGLHLSTGGLAWIQNSYMLALGGLLLLGGRAGDILGRRRVFVAGILLFTLASLAGGFATTSWWLITARVLQGVGAAIAGPSAMALIATNFEGPARVRALSVFSAVTGAGAAIGMITGGLLTDWTSWRWVFFVNVPIGLVIALLASWSLEETPARPGRFDVAGAVTGTLGMTALVYGFIGAGTDGWRDPGTGAAFALALVALGAFVAVERRARQPVVPLRLFADRDRAAAYLTQLLLVGALFGAFYFLTQYLQNVLDFDPLQAGTAFLPMVLAQFALVRTVPRLLPRFGARPLVVTGAALLTAGLLWLTQISADSGYLSALLGPMTLMGAGGGLTIMPLNVTILAGVPQQESGAASGLAQTMLWGGAALGTAVLVTVFGAGSGHGAGDQAFLDGMRTAVAAAAGFVVSALLVVLFVLRSRPRS